MKDPAGNNHYSVEPFVGADVPDESGEAAVTRLAARYGMKRAVCLAMIDDVIESFGKGDDGTQDRNGADAETIRQLNARQRQAWHILVAYQANQKTAQDMQMSTRVMALELGYYTVAGADNVAELARKIGIKKQTVNKCAANFQTKLGLPPRPGQRDDAARSTMATARNGQLRK